MKYCIDCEKYGMCKDAQYADDIACQHNEEVHTIINPKIKHNGSKNNAHS